MTLLSFLNIPWQYCQGLSEYNLANNCGGVDAEDCWDSVRNESQELYEAIWECSPTNIILELCDTLHALFKFIVVRYLPIKVYTHWFFWLLFFPVLLPASIKLGRRRQQFGCIRNHKNPMNRDHLCCFKKQKGPLKIYYSVSVRGNQMSQHDVVAQIKVLQRFGTVLTEHLGRQADPVGATDQDIFEMDQELIKECDLFVAELSSPSHGVGYMLARAVELNKPVLGLVNHSQTVSAMLRGNPKVTLRQYADVIDLHRVMSSFLSEMSMLMSSYLYQPPISIWLAGAPGLGKSTLAKYLCHHFNLVHVSTGQLLREQAETDPNLSAIMNQGKLVPSHLVRDLVLSRLNDLDCQLQGYILDGYPPSHDDLENVLHLSPDLIMVLQGDAELAVQRQCQRQERVTDQEIQARQRVILYYDQNPDFIHDGSKWFPETPVVAIKANRDLELVQYEAMELIENMFYPPTTRSYFPIPISPNRILSTQFHAHIDAENVSQLQRILRRVGSKFPQLQGQSKIYPIQALALGPQSQDPALYGEMDNFHEIPFGSNLDEAFVTHRLGDTLDPESMNALLISAKESKIPCSVELEQYLMECELTPEGSVTISSDFPYSMGYDPISELMYQDHMVLPIKANSLFELHHGFNLPKCTSQPPINLQRLIKKCAELGFNNGGWFIFAHEDHWSYRSNEFVIYPKSIQECIDKLHTQARELQKIISDLLNNTETCTVSLTSISSSLEVVHGIWKF